MSRSTHWRPRRWLALLVSPVLAAGLILPASGAGDKVYPAAVASGFDLRPGPSVRTDRPLDVLPEEGAFLQVRLPGGGQGFTRDGRLSVDGERWLVSSGHQVLDRAGNPIRIPADEMPAVDPDGGVSVRGVRVAELGLYRLEGHVDRVGPTLLAPGSSGRALPAEVKVHSGEIEMSNSPPLEAAVQLISAQRAFDSSMQALQTYRRMDDRSTDIGRVR